MTFEKESGNVNEHPQYEGKNKSIGAFEVSVWLSLSVIARTLQQSKNVTNLRKRKWFSSRSDTHIRFDYCNKPFVVYEEWGDCDVYWVCQENFVGSKIDIQELFQLFIDAKLTHYLKQHKYAGYTISNKGKITWK